MGQPRTSPLDAHDGQGDDCRASPLPAARMMPQEEGTEPHGLESILVT